MFLIYIFLRLFASYVATFSTWVSFAQRKCATGTENMHVICIFGYYNTDDLRKAAFLCGCVPIGCVPANSRFHPVVAAALITTHATVHALAPPRHACGESRESETPLYIIFLDNGGLALLHI